MEKQKKTKKVDFKGFFLQYGPRFLISSLVSLIAFLLIFLLNKSTLISAVDGTFYAFIISFVCGAFSFITNKGFFDIFAYNALKVGRFFSPKSNEEVDRFNGTYDYTKTKIEKRKAAKFNFLAYFAASILWLVATIVLFIIYKQM